MADESAGVILNWEQLQYAAMPANATSLIPPPPGVEAAETVVGSAPANLDWLDDSGTAPIRAEEQPAGDHSQGVPAGHVLAQMIAVNAIWDYATHPPREEDDEDAKELKRPRRKDEADE